MQGDLHVQTSGMDRLFKDETESDSNVKQKKSIAVANLADFE